MGIQVAFDYPAWVARYPEFAQVNEPTANAYFAEASVYHDNSGVGEPTNATVQLALLNMMTAHIAARYAIINGVAPAPFVGRINSATEGSVSVGIEGFTNAAPGSQQWLITTRYGSDYWYATTPYRTMRYITGPRRVFDAVFPPVIVSR